MFRRGLVVAAAAACLFAGAALAHEAASGWRYPFACCSNADCRQVHVDDVEENADGGWTYLPLKMRFSRDKVRPSGDRHFHVCYTPALTPLCVFILSGS